MTAVLTHPVGPPAPIDGMNIDADAIPLGVYLHKLRLLAEQATRVDEPTSVRKSDPALDVEAPTAREEISALTIAEAQIETMHKYATCQTMRPIFAHALRYGLGERELPLAEHLFVWTGADGEPLHPDNVDDGTPVVAEPAQVRDACRRIARTVWPMFESQGALLADTLGPGMVEKYARLYAAIRKHDAKPVSENLVAVRNDEIRRVQRGNFGVAFAGAAVAAGRSMADPREGNSHVRAAREGFAHGLYDLGLDPSDVSVNPLSGVRLDPWVQSGFVRDGALAGCDKANRLRESGIGCSVCPARQRLDSSVAP